MGVSNTQWIFLWLDTWICLCIDEEKTEALLYNGTVLMSLGIIHLDSEVWEQGTHAEWIWVMIDMKSQHDKASVMIVW